MWCTLTKRILLVHPLLDLLGDGIAIDHLAAVSDRRLVVLNLIPNNVIGVHVADEDILILAVVEIKLVLVIAHQLNGSHWHMLSQGQLLPTVNPGHGVEGSIQEQWLLLTGVGLNGFNLVMNL